MGLPKSLLKNIDKIDKALQNVKIADPAIGSADISFRDVNEIVKVRNIITEYMLMSQYFRYEKLMSLRIIGILRINWETEVFI